MDTLWKLGAKGIYTHKRWQGEVGNLFCTGSGYPTFFIINRVMYKAFHSLAQQLRKKNEYIFCIPQQSQLERLFCFLVKRALKVLFSLHRVNLNIIIGKRFLCFSQVVFLRGSEWGYLINTSFFWLYNMKQLNFRHLTLTVKII